MCPKDARKTPLTLLSDLGQFLDLCNLLLAFLGEEVLRPHTPFVFMQCVSRILRDPVVILRPIDDRGGRNKTVARPNDEHSEVEPGKGVVTANLPCQ